MQLNELSKNNKQTSIVYEQQIKYPVENDINIGVC